MMTSNDLLNEVLGVSDGAGRIADPALRRRIELHLSGVASEAADKELRNFDERLLEGVAVSRGEDADTVNVHIHRSQHSGVPKDRREPTATLEFVGDGTNYGLVAFPYCSLRDIAKFILETMDDYETADQSA